MLQKLRYLLVPALCLSAALLSSCESQQPAATAAPAATAEKPAAPSAAAARYECPMQCAGSQSDKPGKCPTCGMDLEKKS